MRWLGLGVGLLLLAPAFGGDAAKETKALQGKWEGKIKDRDEVELVISEKNWSMRLKNKEGVMLKGAFTVDVKVLPHTLDLKVDDASGDELEKLKGKTSLAIYELKGDTLRLCAAEPGKETRPNEFVDRDGQVFIEFRRLK